MASVMALPLEGYLKSMIQILSLLNSKHNVVAVFDPTDPDIELTNFSTEDRYSMRHGI